MVVFEKKYGSKSKYEGNSRIYEIPISGIFITQFKVNEGFLDRKFYYVDSLRQRTPIQNFSSEEDAQKSNDIGIFYSGTVGVLGNSGDSLSVVFQEFIVSDYVNLQSFFTKEYKKIYINKLQVALGYEIK